METCKSPRKALRVAYDLARGVLPDHTKKFSRKDFTLPQLFACLVVREVLRLSYRKAEEFLRDSIDWLADIGLSKPPDHNTLWRAFGVICKPPRLNRMLDVQAELFRRKRRLKLHRKPLAADSTCYERHHRSRHYERRCRHMGLPPGGKFGRQTRVSGDRARSREHRRMPKLALAGAAACHLVLSARVHVGSGSDAPDFLPLLRDACRRAPVRVAVADSGYDSQANHRVARRELGVRSIIPADAGRPSPKPPTGHYRRLMRRQLSGPQKGKPYGQRAQAETLHSMLKRNLGDELRSRLKPRRKAEMILRTVVHNIMLVGRLDTG
jgi:hypothetical protein